MYFLSTVLVFVLSLSGQITAFHLRNSLASVLSGHVLHRGSRDNSHPSRPCATRPFERTADLSPRIRARGCSQQRQWLATTGKHSVEFTAGSFARGLVPRHLAESADPDVRRLYSLWSDTQHEWAATGYDPDFVSDPKAARGPTRGIYLNPGHYKQPGAEGTQLRTEMKPRK